MTANQERNLARVISDPAEFQRVYLRRSLWAKQQEIIRAILAHRIVAVKGCHASGKTFAAAGLPLWWLVRHREGKVFTTAPTLRQVKLLWDEVGLARRGTPVEHLLPEPTTVGIRLNEGRYGIGASSSRGVNVQGFHSGNVMVIADEAPGIDAEIWDAIEGIRAGGNVRLLMLGNPTISSGTFFDQFTRSRAVCHGISISAFDTPNLQHDTEARALTIQDLLAMDQDGLERAVNPALITRRWVLERYKVWGENHPAYRSRVLAEFPADAPNAVFPLEWIEAAKRDPSEEEWKAAKDRAVQVGIDVAGSGGDETALCARVNGIILMQRSWADADPRGAVLRAIGELRERRLRIGAVVVDMVGIGYNFGLHLADQGLEVYGFNAGSRPLDTTQYRNLKAEANFTLREWMRQKRISGLADLECEAQLSSMQYRETSTGQVEIESKDEMKRRGLQSPDRAEALMMAFARIIPREQTVYRDDLRVQISPI